MTGELACEKPWVVRISFSWKRSSMLKSLTIFVVVLIAACGFSKTRRHESPFVRAVDRRTEEMTTEQEPWLSAALDDDALLVSGGHKQQCWHVEHITEEQGVLQVNTAESLWLDYTLGAALGGASALLFANLGEFSSESTKGSSGKSQASNRSVATLGAVVLAAAGATLIANGVKNSMATRDSEHDLDVSTRTVEGHKTDCHEVPLANAPATLHFPNGQSRSFQLDTSGNFLWRLGDLSPAERLALLVHGAHLATGALSVAEKSIQIDFAPWVDLVYAQAYDKAKTSIAGLQTFINDYQNAPQSVEAQLALNALRADALASAREAGTREAVSAFLHHFPQASERPELEALIVAREMEQRQGSELVAGKVSWDTALRYLLACRDCRACIHLAPVLDRVLHLAQTDQDRRLNMRYSRLMAARLVLANLRDQRPGAKKDFYAKASREKELLRKVKRRIRAVGVRISASTGPGTACVERVPAQIDRNGYFRDPYCADYGWRSFSVTAKFRNKWKFPVWVYPVVVACDYVSIGGFFTDSMNGVKKLAPGLSSAGEGWSTSTGSYHRMQSCRLAEDYPVDSLPKGPFVEALLRDGWVSGNFVGR